MANQDTHEMGEAKLAPSEDGQRPIMVQYDTSPDPHVGPKEVLKRHDPSPQDNPQPQDPNQDVTNVEGHNLLLGLSFPRKLWRIVEDNTFTSMSWNEDGDTLIIDVNLFQKEIICRKEKNKIFESKSLKGFICLLNLHGFRKICQSNSSICSPGNRMMSYKNSNFQRDKPWLLDNISTEGNRMMTRALRRAKRQKMASTEYYPKIDYNYGNNNVEEKDQNKAKNDWGPSAEEFFKYLGLRPTRRAMEVHYPSEASGEGTSGNVMFVPLATARNDGTGDLPTSPSNDPFHGSVMSSYNVCYSTLNAGSSVMPPLEDPDKEEEKEGSSNNKCSLSEQFKDNVDH